MPSLIDTTCRYCSRSAMLKYDLALLSLTRSIPLGVGHARHVGKPVAHNLAVNACCRIVVVVTCTRGQHRHCHCAAKDGSTIGQFHEILFSHISISLDAAKLRSFRESERKNPVILLIIPGPTEVG